MDAQYLVFICDLSKTVLFQDQKFHKSNILWLSMRLYTCFHLAAK